MTRYYMDCREMPSETNCDLAMAGSEEHLVDAAGLNKVQGRPFLVSEVESAIERLLQR